MGCACGSKGSVARSSYVATFTDGSTKTYASEVEAQAAVARRGGGVVRIKK